MCVRKKIFIFLVLLFLVLLIWLYYSFNPARESFFVKCPFKTLTGLDCPGCGSQRAIHELLHFNFLNAISYNALLVFSVPYIVLGIFFQNENIKKKYPKIRKVLFGTKAIYILIFIIIIFFVLRNIYSDFFK